MSAGDQQLEFAFPSLDFPGRVTLKPEEIAERLGVTPKHIYDLIEEGEICAVDLAGKGALRRYPKIPLESYRDFIVARLTGPRRRELLAAMPKPTLRALLNELKELLAA